MLLKRILQRGDRLAVESGRLILRPQSGRQAEADQWLAERYDQVLSEVLSVTGQPAYRYTGYSTGCYRISPKSDRKADGLTLQLIDLLTGEPVYCVFNVSLRRTRSTRHGNKGSMLPAGHFTAAKGSAFVLFWQRAGLALPRRLAAFHDYMGKLAPITFAGAIKSGSELEKQRLYPLEITHEQLLQAVGLLALQPDKCRTTPGQMPDNSRTRAPDKGTPQRQQPRGLQPDSTTGANRYGSRLTVTRVTGEPLPPETDPWLLEYEQALTGSGPH